MILKNKIQNIKMEELLPIIERIKELMMREVTDEEIHDIIDREFPKILNFGMCSYIDNVLFNTNILRGYWRKTYNFPYEGEQIYSKDGTATDCGLFTFNIVYNNLPSY